MGCLQMRVMRVNAAAAAEAQRSSSCRLVLHCSCRAGATGGAAGCIALMDAGAAAHSFTFSKKRLRCGLSKGYAVPSPSDSPAAHCSALMSES